MLDGWRRCVFFLTYTAGDHILTNSAPQTWGVFVVFSVASLITSRNETPALTPACVLQHKEVVVVRAPCSLR